MGHAPRSKLKAIYEKFLRSYASRCAFATARMHVTKYSPAVAFSGLGAPPQ